MVIIKNVIINSLLIEIIFRKLNRMNVIKFFSNIMA